jgi:hypothetical protein
VLESVYIETTIPSLLAARPSVTAREAARQQATQDWWIMHRQHYELFSSEVVWEEAEEGDAAMAQARLQFLKDTALLGETPAIRVLVEQFMKAGVLPVFADRDAAHIAYSCIHGIDYLLTWNCKHIANANIQRKLRKVAATNGYELPIICTPEELMYDNDNS